jgi:misacylated tRNA(Ala) deacylase
VTATPERTAPTNLLYATDAYLQEFDGQVVARDEEHHVLALSRTVFFPGGGGQPHDQGVLRVAGTELGVTAVAKGPGGLVWHTVDADSPLPDVGADVHGVLDWNRRYLLMRTHTALHVLNGIIWLDHGAKVTGANMTPGEGRLDFELPAMSREFARVVEARVNEEAQRDLPIRVLFIPRSEADRDPSLQRLKADRIPRSIDPLRVIDIVGLDRQADGGTFVSSTREVGSVRVVRAESKGRSNKRIRIALESGH